MTKGVTRVGQNTETYVKNTVTKGLYIMVKS